MLFRSGKEKNLKPREFKELPQGHIASNTGPFVSPWIKRQQFYKGGQSRQQLRPLLSTSPVQTLKAFCIQCVTDSWDKPERQGQAPTVTQEETDITSKKNGKVFKSRKV